MKATYPAAIAEQLNSTMLGRCCLAHAEGFDSDGDPSDWPDRLQRCMAQVFESLAAEITVLRQEEPNLSAEAFARQLLEEADLGDDTWPDQEDEDDEDVETQWHTHPSLTAEQRNSSLWS